MNVFTTNPDPILCAEILADQHVRSQLGETARLLTTALSRHDITAPLLGKPYNPNGRFAKWAAQDWNHFMWLAYHGFALSEEHERRFSTVHKSHAEIVAAANIGILMLGDYPRTPEEWPRCEAAASYDSEDVFGAYQNVLRNKYEAWQERGGKRTPRWTNAYPPSWLMDTREPIQRGS